MLYAWKLNIPKNLENKVFMWPAEIDSGAETVPTAP